MSGLSFLIPVALLLGLLGLAAFFWALKRGQFEDLDGAALRILDDEDPGEAQLHADAVRGPGARGTAVKENRCD